MDNNRKDGNQVNFDQFDLQGGNNIRRNGLFQRKPWLLFLIILAAIFLVAFIFFNSPAKPLIASSELSNVVFENNAGGLRNTGYIKLIRINGVIAAESSGGFLSSDTGYNHKFIMNEIKKATNDEENKGLFLAIESPGGGVYETDEVYGLLEEYKKKTNRPIYVSMGRVAASGGYYIAAPADKIIANRNTWLGSIGVTTGTTFDVSKFLEKNGIKVNIMDSGKHKNMGNMYREMTPEERSIWQSLINESYERFVDIVARGRKMSVEQAKALADGRIYTAKQAFENKLIDGIGDEKQAMEAMIRDKQLKGVKIIEVIPEKKGFMENLLASINKLDRKSEITSVLSFLMRGNRYPVSYLNENLI